MTIAIPTFNRGRSYLPRALMAACRQSYANIDILVADNASSDNTEQVVRSVGDSRIRYHRHGENVGSARNTNFCIEASRGEYTLILNDDDIIDATLVAACIGALTNGVRPGLIRTGTRTLDEASGTVRTYLNQVAGLDFTEFVVAWTRGLTTPFLCSTLFRTEPLKRVGMHSQHYLWDDVITELKLAATHGRVDILEVHATYCEHHGELTRAATVRAWCEDSVELLDLVCRLAPDDSALLRAHLVPFLAELAYRRSAEMNAPVMERLRGGLLVHRMLGVPPRTPGWIKQVLAREGWYKVLARLKHVGRRWMKRDVPSVQSPSITDVEHNDPDSR